MEEKNLPSSSDESDADFIPKEDNNSDSISEATDFSEDEEKVIKNRKRKKGCKKVSKKQKVNINEIEEKSEEPEEKKKIDLDALWADFKKDVNSKVLKKADTLNSDSLPSVSQNNLNSIKNKPLVGGVLNKSKTDGLSKLVSQIGKKNKMSTLQLSWSDWNKFKKSEGIEEEIKLYNKGKDGYLEKQDFLQRTDLRQFEIEKNLRTSRKKF